MRPGSGGLWRRAPPERPKWASPFGIGCILAYRTSVASNEFAHEWTSTPRCELPAGRLVRAFYEVSEGAKIAEGRCRTARLLYFAAVLQRLRGRRSGSRRSTPAGV